MNIQGYQKMTLLDFPGKVACTVFTGGCNLRCPFCHNASLVQTPTIYVSSEEDVLQYLQKRKGVLDGVCVTGGEPLLQPDLIPFLQKVKDMGFLLKLDTNGSLPAKLKQVLETGLLDYIAMDVKNSKEGYPLAIGADTDFSLFEESMKLIKESGVPYEFRTTLVKGIHTPKDMHALGQMLKDAPRYFLQKFVDSGDILGNGCSPFSEQDLNDLLTIVQHYIPHAELRG